MTPSLTAAPVDTVPGNARVGHYDELSDGAKRSLFEAVTGGATPPTVDRCLEDEFREWDVIKFTDYVEVRVD